MSKETNELRELTDEKLIKEKENLLISILQTSKGMLHPQLDPVNRGQVRRRIARVNTIMGERGHRGVLKEEKRIK